MISKAKLKEHIDNFSEDEISIDDLIDRLIFIEKLESRIKISEQSDSLISNETMKDEIYGL